MRNLSEDAGKYFKNLVFALIAIGITSCGFDDDDPVNLGIPQPTGTINVEDQALSGNIMEVTSVTVSANSWLVVKKVNEDGSFTDIIADPVLIQMGTTNNIDIELKNVTEDYYEIEDGDTLVLMLHADDGDGNFLYNPRNVTQDLPIRDASGNVVTETFLISSPTFEIEDQDVEDGTITFTTVLTKRTGWIVVYNSTSTGTINEAEIIGFTYLEEGDNADVVVTFDDTFTYTTGQTVFARIHLDDPDDEEFTYIEDEDTDMPEIFGFGTNRTITDSFIIN